MQDSETDWDDGADGFAAEAGQGGFARAVPGELGVGALLGDSWELVKTHTVEAVGGMILAFGVLYGIQAFITLGIYLVAIVAMLGFAAIESVIGETAATVLAMTGVGFGYLLLLSLILVIQTMALAAYQAMWLRLIRGDSRKVEYTIFLKTFALPLSLVALINFGATMLGSLALIIGAYVVMLGLFFATHLVFDWGLTAKRALVGSWDLMNGHKLELLLLFLALVAVNLAGILTCGVGMLITMPISFGALTLFYDRIARPGNVFLEL